MLDSTIADFQKELSPVLRLREVLALLHISRSCWYSGMAKGHYPQPVHIGARAVAWRRDDIQRLLEGGVPEDALEVTGAAANAD